MKKALITGASSGIGFEYAKHLDQNGWSLDLVSYSEDRSKIARRYFQDRNNNYYHLDLSRKDSVAELLEKVDCPDLVVANAGITMVSKAGESSSLQRDDLYYLLCGGVIDLIEGLLPRLKEKDTSRIVIISSIGAVTPMPKSSLYASAKSGIYAYGRSIGEELANEKISVTISLPGYVKTNAHKRAGLDHLEKKIPFWMWVSAEKVVKMTEKASLAGKSKVIPGLAYKLVKPFLGLEITSKLWKILNKRN
jgi:short-subunit dehydrogenase